MNPNILLALQGLVISLAWGGMWQGIKSFPQLERKMVDGFVNITKFTLTWTMCVFTIIGVTMVYEVVKPVPEMVLYLLGWETVDWLSFTPI